MISSPATPAMRCEVARFDARGLPLELRWTTSQSNFLGARERGIVLSTATDQAGDRSIETIAQWNIVIKKRYTGSTPENYSWCVRKFSIWCRSRGLRLADVQQNTIEGFLSDLREKGYKPNSVRVFWKGLRAFYAWAADEYNAPNPTAKLKGPRVPAGIHSRDALTDEEMLALMATCGQDKIGVRDRAIISLMAYSGLRQAEVHHSDLGDIETREGRAILWVMGKGHQGRDEYIVLSAPAENALREWLAVRPGPSSGPIFTALRHDQSMRQQRIGKQQIRHIVFMRLRMAGIRSPRKTTHSLRHSAITNAIRNGATPLQAMAMARHKDLRNTLIYYHESDRLQHPAEDLIVYSSGAEEKKTDDHKSKAAD